MVSPFRQRRTNNRLLAMDVALELAIQLSVRRLTKIRHSYLHCDQRDNKIRQLSLLNKRDQCGWSQSVLAYSYVLCCSCACNATTVQHHEFKPRISFPGMGASEIRWWLSFVGLLHLLLANRKQRNLDKISRTFFCCFLVPSDFTFRKPTVRLQNNGR